MARRRARPLLLATVLMMAGTTAGLSSVQAAQADETGERVRLEAEQVLDTATAGRPIEVVTTRDSADGPVITSSPASTRSDARQLIESALERPSTVGVDLAQPVRAAVSNDPYRSRQWALTHLEAEKVWRKSKGSGVVVAVVDSGVRTTHKDLASRVLRGYDFVDPGTSAEDTNGHGTHVAGIIAARANNGRGGAGLAPSVRILPVRVLGRSGGGDTADVARGIVWAVNHGADVVNLSVEATTADTASREAVAYALRRNVVVVAAAGNNGCQGLAGSPTTYPAAYPGVIAVGSINRNKAVSSYSSCGTFVDVVAPGSRIISTTVYRPATSLGCPARTSYCTLNGTSMAAPHVSASAAILIARLGTGWRASTVSSIITKKADDQGVRGWDRSTGYGRLNTWRMLYGH